MAAEPTVMREVRESIVIAGQPDEIFEYFVVPEALVEWMGQSAQLDPHPGGELAIQINGSSIEGRFEVVDPPRRLVFTWGVSGSADLPPGSSRVEVLLTKEAYGTRVELIHRGLPEHERIKHARGWRYFLGRVAELRTG